MNDLGSIEQIGHLLTYDTTRGRLDYEVLIEDNCLVVGQHTIRVTQERDPSSIGWGNRHVDVVIEATGVMTDAKIAKGRSQAGARKVLIAAPARNEDITLVFGVNHEDYDGKRHNIISNASCTTNCLAPMVKVLHKEIGVSSGWMTTIHAFTQDQNLQDGLHKDLRRARSAAANIIPTTTGAATAIALVIPEMLGRLDGYSVRVPVITGSLVDLAVNLERDVTADEINKIFQKLTSLCAPIYGG